MYLYSVFQVVIKSGKFISVSLPIAYTCEQEKGKEHLRILRFLFCREKLVRDCKKDPFMFSLAEKPRRAVNLLLKDATF